MRTISCKCCGRKAEVTGNNVGDSMRESDMQFVFLSDGNSAWLCDEPCTTRILEGYKIFAEVLGEEAAGHANLHQFSLIAKRRVTKPPEPHQSG